MNPVPPPMASKNNNAATTAPTRKRIVKLLFENIIGSGRTGNVSLNFQTKVKNT